MTNRVDEAPRESYYGDGRQPWDDIVAGGFGGPFAAASVLKYIRRTKGEYEKDTQKARWYYTQLCELIGRKDLGALAGAEWLVRTMTAIEFARLAP